MFWESSPARATVLPDSIHGGVPDHWESWSGQNRQIAVRLGHGRVKLTAWLRRNIGNHDRLVVSGIADANPGHGVLGVSFSRRTSDAIARAGHPNGITPTTGAKVKFDGARLITQFNNGPYGGASNGCRIS